MFIASCAQVNDGETLHVDVQLPAMKPVLNSRQKHLSLVFSPLRENRLHVTSRGGGDDVTGGHVTGDVIGEVVVARADSLKPVCVLNFPVPAVEPSDVEVDEMMIERVLMRKKKVNKKKLLSNGSFNSQLANVPIKYTDNRTIEDMISNLLNKLALWMPLNITLQIG